MTEKLFFSQPAFDDNSSTVETDRSPLSIYKDHRQQNVIPVALYSCHWNLNIRPTYPKRPLLLFPLDDLYIIDRVDCIYITKYYMSSCSSFTTIP